jgi:ribosome-associated toxin RatA of RatAB toxin-antitoxin module
MRSSLGIFSGIVIALALGIAAGDAAAVSFSAVEKEKLAAGKCVKQPLPKSGDSGFYGGTGYIIADAPVEVVWQAIQDWGSYHKMFPKTVAVTEVSRKNDSSLIKMEMGHALIRVEYFMDIRRDEEKHMLSFKLVANRPHDIEETRGYWRLFPQADGRTLVAYVVATQIPMGIINLIPSDLVAKIQRNLLAAPEDVKRWVEGPQGTRYRTTTAKN